MIKNFNQFMVNEELKTVPIKDLVEAFITLRDKKEISVEEFSDMLFAHKLTVLDLAHWYIVEPELEIFEFDEVMQYLNDEILNLIEEKEGKSKTNEWIEFCNKNGVEVNNTGIFSLELALDDRCAIVSNLKNIIK